MSLVEDLLPSLAATALVSLPVVIYLRSRDMTIVPFIASLFTLGGFSALANIPDSPLYLEPSDGAFYVEWAMEIYEGFHGDPMPSQPIWPAKGLWPLGIAIFFVIFGTSNLALHTAVVLMSACITVILQKILKTISPTTRPHAVAWIYLTSPAVVVYSSLLFREIPFLLGVALGLLGLTYLHERRLGPSVAAIVLSSLLCVGLRPDLGMVFTYSVLGIAILFLAFQRWHNQEKRQFKFLLLFAAALAASFPFSLEFATTSVSLTSNETVSSTSIAEIRDYVSSTSDNPVGSGNDQLSCGHQIQWVAAVFCSLETLPSIVFGPFPMINPTESSVSQWVFFGATVHFLFVVSLAISYLLRTKSLLVLSALTISATILAAVAVVGTNYGIVFRLRLPSELVLIPFAAAVTQRKIRGQRRGAY